MQAQSVLEALAKQYDRMFAAEKKVADYILAQPDEVVRMNVSELAGASCVSDATVVRMCKHIGYEGYYQMKIHLSHELGRNELRERRSDARPETAKGLLEALAYGILNIAEALDTQEIRRCVRMLRAAGTVYIAAVGNTVPAAMDLGHRLERFGIRTCTHAVVEYLIAAVGNAQPGDLLVAISGSGSSRQVLQAAELGRSKGIPCIAITRERTSPLTKLADPVLVTHQRRTLFDERYGLRSHLGEMAVNDLLIYFLILDGLGDDTGAQRPDASLDVEHLLSETRI